MIKLTRFYSPRVRSGRLLIRYCLVLAGLTLAAPLFAAEQPKPDLPELSPEESRFAKEFTEGVDHLNSRDFQGALKIFEGIQKKLPDCLTAGFCVGMALACAGRDDEAIEKFSRLLESRPDLWLGYCFRAWSYMKKESWESAIADLDKAGRLRPDDRWISLSRAECLSSTGKFEEAREQYDAILKKNPEEWGALIGKARACAQLSEPENARELLSKLPLEEDLSDEQLLSKSRALSLAGAIEEAIQVAERCIDRNPGLDYSWANMSWVLAQGAQLERFETVFSRCVEKHPGQAAAHFHLGIARAWTVPASQSEDFVRSYKLEPDQFPSRFSRMCSALPTSPETPEPYRTRWGHTLADVAVRTNNVAWARKFVEVTNSGIFDEGDKRWYSLRFAAADGRFKDAVGLLDTNFDRLPLSLTEIERSEEFRTLCASPEYQSWKFPPGGK